jgi:hypothetical protein
MIPRLVEPYVPLPPVIQLAEREEPAQPAQPEHAKKLLIVHSKDVASEERKIFQFWGKVAVWDDRYTNIPLDRLPESDYIFMDMRLKSARVALGSADLSHYAVVSYVPWYHKGEKFISQLSSVALTKFPLRATSKADFERQLLSEKVESPSIARTFIGWLVPCLQA